MCDLLLLLLLLIMLLLLLVLLMLLKLELLLLSLNLLLSLYAQSSHVLLRPFQCLIRESALAHTSKDQRNHGRRNATIQRVSQHALLDFPLLDAKSFLLGALLFLLTLVLLGLCLEPVAHRLILTGPLAGRCWKAS
jgi:hypothetical protein